jgi:hypothetical protein
MGSPMAQRLLDAGHEPALWSHSTGNPKAIAGPKATGCQGFDGFKRDFTANFSVKSLEKDIPATPWQVTRCFGSNLRNGLTRQSKSE